ncbi:hypothetical protein Gpo141_00008568, partial [Globisporangium polare]
SSKFQDGLKNPEVLLNQICVQMEDLEERFTKVSSTAVVIGDKLHSLDQERARVLETDEMMEALLALNDPSSKLSKSSNRLFNTLQDPAQLHEASRVIKKMCVFSTELSSPVTAHAVGEIERLSQTIENDLLNEFSDAQEKDNDKGMKKCAESLIEYNDKEKIADRYVWNVMKDRLAKNMSFTTVSSLDPIQDLESLFAKISGICKDQFTMIHKVFPPSACNSIRELLVERLFNDPAFGIFSYLDQFLNARPRSATGSSGDLASSGLSSDDLGLEYVRLLCAAYEKTCDLATAIESMIEPPPQVKAAPVNPATPDSPKKDHGDPADDDDDDDDTLSPDRERMRTFLNLQLHSLFGSHRQRYFRTELDLVQRQFKDIFAQVKFPQQLTAKQKAAATKSKHNNVASVNANAPAHSSSASSLSVAAASSSNFEKDGVISPSAPAEVSLTYFETLLSIADDDAVPEKYSTATKETIGRCDFILKDSELRAELVTKVFSSFVASFGDEYIGKSSAMMSEILQEPLLTKDSARQFFSILEFLLKQIDFFEEQFENLVSPALSDSPTQFTICYENKRRCLDKLERSIASGLQQVFAVVEKLIGSILATTQDKSDFIGSETNMSLSCSRACRKCIEYLQPLVTTICQVLLDENRDRFLIALCTTFKDLYLQHLQKYRFDPDGACMLLRDVNAYRQIFRSFRHAAIDDLFDILHEVANIFALPPENLAGFVRDGKLARMSRQSLMDIVKRRWDYKTSVDKIML